MKKKPRLTMNFKFCLIFTAIVVFIIAGIAAANHILLGKIYDREKRKTLTEAYETINKVFTEDNGVDSVELERIYSTKNITVYILDSQGKMVFSSSADAGDFRPGEEAWDKRSEAGTQNEVSEEKNPRRYGGPRHGNFISPELQPFADFARDKLKDNEYIIDEVNDNRLGTSFIQLTAKLFNGYILYMRTPVAAIDEAAKTANNLLIYIGIAGIILSLIIIAMVSGAATKPIRELTDIAKDMSELKFFRRYTDKRNDEIGDLGESINILSGKLEKAISELKESNAQLEKDIELKNSVDKMRKEFIANASHELKTPLALISGYAEGLKTNIAVSEENRDFYCDVIIDEAKHMDKIIKQFLTITELEAAEMCEKKELDFSTLVKNIVRSSSILVKQNGVSIELNCQDGITVVGDELALEQAVSNYITNAIHHVDDRGTIEVKLVQNGGKARFSVFNSGKPIPEEGAERIWDSFYKFDKARTRSYGGSGLGLAIVKKSVELHGGIYGFNNTDDGVEFFFEI